MGLKSWWERIREEGIQAEVDDLCEEYIQEKDTVQPYYEYRKKLKHQFFPKKGDDLLAKKQEFIESYSVRERQFREQYISEGANIYSPLKSKVVNNKVQEARLIAQVKWRKMVSYMR